MGMPGHGSATIRLCPLILVPAHNWPVEVTISKAKKGHSGEGGQKARRREGEKARRREGVGRMSADVRGSEGYR